MSKVPVIGIPCAQHAVSRKVLPQFLTDTHYMESTAAAGGIPVQLPILAGTPDEFLQEMVDRCDGFLLPGGPDFSSEWYHEPLLPSLKPSKVSMDLASQDTALRFIRLAAASGKPIFGICLGMQVLNIALGGSLIQDIPSQIPGAVTHRMRVISAESRYRTAHTVTTMEGSLIRRLSGSEFPVNSFHHQAVRHLAPGFHISAYAPDGLPEAIEHESAPILAVQWHPENLARAGVPEAQALFQWLIEAAK